MLVEFLGWCLTHSFNLRQSLVARKNELVINYLINVYRILENSCDREDYFKSDINTRELEAALGDFMMFGNNEEQQLAHDYLRKIDAVTKSGENKKIDIEELREKLRGRLREELN